MLKWIACQLSNTSAHSFIARTGSLRLDVIRERTVLFREWKRQLLISHYFFNNTFIKAPLQELFWTILTFPRQPTVRFPAFVNGLDAT